MMNNQCSNDKWDVRFMSIARQISTWSKDPSTQVGAVCVRDRRILSTGYNGFPCGVDDRSDRLSDRQTKYELTVHAEMNAIYNAVHHGISLDGATLYVYGLPICSECAKGVIQSGIRRVVYTTLRNDGYWDAHFERSREMFDEVGVTYFKIL